MPPTSAGKTEPESGLSDQVERHVGHRDVVFESRGMAAPLGDPVAENEAGVAHSPQERPQTGSLPGGHGPGADHMCSTSSGTSKKDGWR